MVDGDEFFGDDPTVATKNLGAQGVESVVVYEEENEDESETADETIQVMDLRLKEGAKKGYFGTISGAIGANTLQPNDPFHMNFYEGELLANRFKDDFKIFSPITLTLIFSQDFGMDIKSIKISVKNK